MSYMDLAIGRTRIDVLRASGCSWTEMASDKSSVDRMAPVCNHAAVFGMSLHPRL